MKTGLAVLCAVRVSAKLPGVACFGCFGFRGQLFLGSQLCLATHQWLCATACRSEGEMLFLSVILNLFGTKAVFV